MDISDANKSKTERPSLTSSYLVFIKNESKNILKAKGWNLSPNLCFYCKNCLNAVSW